MIIPEHKKVIIKQQLHRIPINKINGPGTLTYMLNHVYKHKQINGMKLFIQIPKQANGTKYLVWINSFRVFRFPSNAVTTQVQTTPRDKKKKKRKTCVSQVNLKTVIKRTQSFGRKNQ